MHVQSHGADLPPEGSDSGVIDVLQSSVPLSEFEAKVRDLEENAANLLMDNMALTTKLKASCAMEKLQQEKVTTLEERLVQVLRLHVSMHFWSMHAVFESFLGTFLCTLNRKLLLKSSCCQRPGNHSWKTRLPCWK